MARYLLDRVAELHGVTISIAPKLFAGWNGAGCHVNYDIAALRTDNSYHLIMEMMEKMAAKHELHLALYGDNSKRLTGEHETSSPDKFSWGVGSRGTSVRIPTSTAAKKRGYWEDRRPASDIDPYIVGAALIDTTVLKESKLAPLYKHFMAWKEWRAKQTFVLY